jgi:hypothetical protein
MVLATLDDYEEILGVTAANPDQVERLLSIASAAVLAHAHGQEIVENTTTATLQPSGGVVRFPQRPVTAVSAVTYDGASRTSGTDYRWTAGGDGQPAYLVRVVNGLDDYWAGPVTVTYTHGWATADIPEPVKVAVVMLALQTIQLVADGGRQVTAESIDDYSRSFAASDDPLPYWIQCALDSILGVTGVTSVQLVRER